MITKEQVIGHINEIEDNGRNTAAEIRTVLSGLLDFSDGRFTQNAEDMKKLGGNLSGLENRVTALENMENDVAQLNENVLSLNSQINILTQDLNEAGKFFHVWSENPVSDKTKTSRLWYSF